jgi:hypothetical protein
MTQPGQHGALSLDFFLSGKDTAAAAARPGRRDSAAAGKWPKSWRQSALTSYRRNTPGHASTLDHTRTARRHHARTRSKLIFFGARYSLAMPAPPCLTSDTFLHLIHV